jgi:hypothetical protein
MCKYIPTVGGPAINIITRDPCLGTELSSKPKATVKAVPVHRWTLYVYICLCKCLCIYKHICIYLYISHKVMATVKAVPVHRWTLNIYIYIYIYAFM